MSAPLLSCRGLTVQREGRVVVREVTLELKPGEVVALLGPNGAGKSTLLEALAGSVAASAGEIIRHGRVALALQSPDLARRSVMANLTAALGWWGVARPERRARAQAALEAMGAGHLAPRPAATLSGGERRRVHLARTLAVAPDVLLLDEPFAGLDPEARALLLEDAVQAVRAPDRATLIVVHDRAEAWALADRLLVMIDGTIAAAGAPRELLEHPPSEPVARFLGFDGDITVDGARLMTRPAHVVLDAAGPHRARVTRIVALQDGVRLELALDTGRLFAVAPLPGPALGDEVRVRLSGGVPLTRSPRLRAELEQGGQLAE